ncbi:hypothetical protein ABW19_dt0204113 [Dactylella cylindrospora]|nr:hypothetical protein ABW19_dt0204113 [Dactylella cylindrospora]
MSPVGSRLEKRLLFRELEGSYIGQTSRQGIYGSRSFVKDLDIVNELYAHAGCVNALSWSQSGNLLASGSDDTHVNIHQRSSSVSTFSFTHSILTGHTQNIFSVKFMPHSGDRTIVSCAGDGEVRVFDVNYSATSIDTANSSFSRSSDQTSKLHHAETNARVYRSHRDRVKRIVTENSPHLFLTCSEDGDVRQFDTRAPSEPRTGRWSRFSRDDDDYSDGPRPLISYRKAPLDLNTISVATSQPHYLALGGSHLYCFLHDRRMLREKDNEPMCVKRFAPREDEPWADRGSRGGHITACKISDYCPNDLVVSWSAGGIGGFDINRSPDALDVASAPKTTPSILESVGTRVKKDKKAKGKATAKVRISDPISEGSASGSGSSKLKRKRKAASRTSSMGSAELEWRASMSPRRSRPSDDGDISVEDIEKTAFRIACSFVEARKILYQVKTPTNESDKPHSQPNTVLEPFTKCLGMVDDFIAEHDGIVIATPSSVIEQQSTPMILETPLPNNEETLRRRRQDGRRYLQAMGALTKLLYAPSDETLSEKTKRMFDKVDPTPIGKPEWAYDYLRVLVEYLKGGVAGVERYWNVSTHDELAEKLKTLLESASGDEDDMIDSIHPSFPGFLNEKSATRSLTTHLLAMEPGSTEVPWEVKRRWGWVHGRSILAKAGENIDYAFMESSFGGLSDEELDLEDEIEKALRERNTITERPIRARIMDVVRKDEELARQEARSSERDGNGDIGEEAALMDEDEIEEEIEIGDDSMQSSDSSDGDHLEAAESARTSAILNSIMGMSAHVDDTNEEEDEDSEGEDDADDDSSDDEMQDYDDDGDDNDEEDDDEGEDEDIPFNVEDIAARRRRRLRNVQRIKTVTRNNRNRLQAHASLEENTRLYRGHCNVQTVKDVNFYGLQDEYVVSGSDCGHVFIWDKETTELIQILHGDSSVVNVVQGHPTEPMLAVSGIDDTIKIFSPDRQLQDRARQGLGMHDDTPLTTRQRFHQKEKIVGDNEIARQNGLSDAVITVSLRRALQNRITLSFGEWVHLLGVGDGGSFD